MLLDTPYQRGDVWGIKRRRNFIKSLLWKIPTPSLVINNRMEADFIGDYPGKFAVIDGKQRLTAILKFVRNAFGIPREWVDPRDFCTDQPLVHYAELTLAGQRRFDDLPLATAETRVRTLDEEREIFDLINFGGLAQGEVDEDI